MSSSSNTHEVVVIQGCTASQLVGKETIKLTSGTLSLEEFADDSTDAKLLIKIADSSFALPIEKNAIVGTRGDRSYLFSKKIPAAIDKQADTTSNLEEIPIEGNTKAVEEDVDVLFVQLDMAVTATEDELTKFESCLVRHGFLTVGVQADADNISRSFLEWTGIKTRDLRTCTLDKTVSGKATDDPTQFSDTTHNVTSGAASGSAAIANAASKIGDQINAVMEGAGAFLGSKLGTKGIFSGPNDGSSETKKDAKEAFSDGVESIGIVGTGIADGAKHFGAAVSETTSQAVEHNYGADAKKVKEETGTAVNNTASVGLTAFQQSSILMHGAEVGKGAVSEE